MNPFDPNAFPEGRGEKVTSYDGVAGYAGHIEVARADVGLPVEESVAHGFGEEDLDDDMLDYALEFALSCDGVIISGGAFTVSVPPGCPSWAWQAFLEGVVGGARGQAALAVAREAESFLGEGGEWEDDEDEEVLPGGETQDAPGAGPTPDLPF